MRRPDGAESQCRTERVRRGCGEGVEGVEGAQGTAGAVASVGLAGCGVYFNQDRFFFPAFFPLPPCGVCRSSVPSVIHPLPPCGVCCSSVPWLFIHCRRVVCAVLRYRRFIQVPLVFQHSSLSLSLSQRIFCVGFYHCRRVVCAVFGAVVFFIFSHCRRLVCAVIRGTASVYSKTRF